MKVNAQVDSRAKALDQRDRAAASCRGLEPSQAEQVARNHAVHRLQHRRQQLGLCGQQRAQVPETAGQCAAFEEGVEPILDEVRQAGVSSVFGLGEEGSCVLLHQSVQRGLLRAMAHAVHRGAVWRPLGLPANGLHAQRPKWDAGTV